MTISDRYAVGHHLLHHQRKYAHHQFTGLLRPDHISATETVSAIAVAAGASPSSVGSATYTISLTPASAPTFSITPRDLHHGADPRDRLGNGAPPTISYTVSGSAGPSVDDLLHDRRVYAND